MNSTGRDAGETLSHDMLNELREDLLQEAGEHVTATGTLNAFVLTIDPNTDAGNSANEITSCPAGFKVKFKANMALAAVGTNQPSILVQKTGPTTIQAVADLVRADGTALLNDEIIVDQEVEAVFDGTKWRVVSQLVVQLGNYKIAIDETLSLNSSITTDQTIITFTLPGGILGTNNELFIRGYTDIPIVNTNRTVNIKLKYGATTVVTSTLIYDATNSPFMGGFEVSLIGTGATNTQRGTIKQHYAEAGYQSAADSGMDVATATSAEDSTGDLTVTLTINITATGNISLDIYNTVAQIIRG